MSKAKLKKQKRAAQIDPGVLTRPRLDELFAQRARGDLDDDRLLAAVRTLMAEAGTSSVMDALIKRMEGTPEGERETLMTLVPRLKSKESIDVLWQRVRKPRALSLDAKMMALVILRELGEEVDLKDPGRHFSPRDFKPSNVQTARDLLRSGVRGLARSLRESRDPAEAEAFMLRINRMPQEVSGGNEILLDMIAQAEPGASDLEADFIYALAQTTPIDEVRNAAETTLARLSVRGVKPMARAVLGLAQDRFYAAYMTDPLHPWQQSVTVAWERAGGIIQALVFLLDFGYPWQGAIKDMFPTSGMTPAQFQRDLVEKPQSKMGERVYRVSLARAQAAIAAAVEANRAHHVVLPEAFTEVRHLVERWVLHPSAAALGADTSRDELGHLPLTPDRSRLPLMFDLRDLQHSAADLPVDEYAFADLAAVRADVAATYEEMRNPWWAREWVDNHLTAFSQRPDKLQAGDEELAKISEHWIWIQDFLHFLDDHAYEIHTGADVRGFHLSEYLEENAVSQDVDDGRHRAEIARDFFRYLGRRGLTAIHPKLLSEIDELLSAPDELTLLPRPRPLGEEIAVWFPQFGAEERDESLTYNEWWMALVLERKFKGNWERARREAQRKPDAGAKLALLDGLERRLAEDSEYLDDLPEERPADPDDYGRAERWFERERVSHAKAW